MNVPLNINFQQILLHLFNFVILAGGLYFLLYKPVKAFMDKRSAHYEALDADAAETRRQAEELKDEYQQKLAGARDEIGQMKAQAAKDAEHLAEVTLQDAQTQKEHILAEAREAAGREKEKMLRQAKEEIVELAVAATAKMARGEK